ncbi:MAG: hypothetical protein LRY71_05160 [Bacillaceae bacterium]|nr:hypothetical protein [Bacillaceae bacterium]
MSNISELRNHKAVLILGDLLCVLAAYIVAFYIRYNGFPQRNWEDFVTLLPWILLIALFFISIYELYALDRKHTVVDIMIKIVVAVIFMAFLTMAASYLFRAFAMPRSIILISIFFSILFMTVFKSIYLKITRGNVVGTVLLVGDDEDTEKMLQKIKHPMLKGTIVKHVHSNIPFQVMRQHIHSVDFVMLCPKLSKRKKNQRSFTMRCKTTKLSMLFHRYMSCCYSEQV